MALLALKVADPCPKPTHHPKLSAFLDVKKTTKFYMIYKLKKNMSLQGQKWLLLVLLYL